MSIPDKGTFESMYVGQPPWDIGRPQRELVEVADRVKGSILDAGCGTGENALFFAERGHDVTGIDFLAQPIECARRKAAERGLNATFLVMDALELAQLTRTFDCALDSGLFHVFSDDDRRRYVDGLAAVLKPGATLYMLCFSDAEPGEQGPRRISRDEIERAFSDGWTIESISPTRFEVRPDVRDIPFSAGGPKAWFVVAKKDLDSRVNR
jgi:SAM-dependent methyltransferase